MHAPHFHWITAATTLVALLGAAAGLALPTAAAPAPAAAASPIDFEGERA
jgi:hypothetical protein